MIQQTDTVQPVAVAEPPPTRSRWWARKPAVIAGVAGLVLLSGSAAYAYWTTGGSGTATATAGTTAAVTITGTVTGTVYPGGSFTVNFTATNPNNAAVAIGTI